jgi:hypothetical protein
LGQTLPLPPTLKGKTMSAAEIIERPDPQAKYDTALARMKDGLKSVSDAERAFKECENKLSIIREEIRKIEAELEAEAPDDPVEAILNGTAQDAPTRRALAEKKVADLEAQADLWRSSRETAEAAYYSRKTSLSVPRLNLEDAARLLVASEHDIDALMVECEKMRVKYLAILGKVAALTSIVPHNEPIKREMQSFLSRQNLLDMHDAPTARELNAKVAALTKVE